MSQSTLTPLQRRPSTSGRQNAIFFVSAAAAIALFVIPTFIIRPFRQQTPRALWLAMALRQHAPLLTLLAAALCFGLAVAIWRHATLRRRFFVVLTLLVVAGSAVMSRLNYFEWMFHPIEGAQFITQSQSKLDAKEMVMAVRVGGEARAYPISQMAYHHILNDTVTGVPIVATY